MEIVANFIDVVTILKNREKVNATNIILIAFLVKIFERSDFPVNVFVLKDYIFHYDEIGHMITNFFNEITCCYVLVDGICEYVVK